MFVVPELATTCHVGRHSYLMVAEKLESLASRQGVIEAHRSDGGEKPVRSKNKTGTGLENHRFIGTRGCDRGGWSLLYPPGGEHEEGAM